MKTLLNKRSSFSADHREAGNPEDVLSEQSDLRTSLSSRKREPSKKELDPHLRFASVRMTGCNEVTTIINAVILRPQAWESR